MSKISKEYIQNYLLKIAEILKNANAATMLLRKWNSWVNLDKNLSGDESEDLAKDLKEKGIAEEDIIYPSGNFLPKIAEYLLELEADKTISIDQDHLVIKKKVMLLEDERYGGMADFIVALIKFNRKHNVLDITLINNRNMVRFRDIGIRLKYPADNSDYNVVLHIKSTKKTKNTFTIERNGKEEGEFTDFKANFLDKLKNSEHQTVREKSNTDFREKFYSKYFLGKGSAIKTDLIEYFKKAGHPVKSFGDSYSQPTEPLYLVIKIKDVGDIALDEWAKKMEAVNVDGVGVKKFVKNTISNYIKKAGFSLEDFEYKEVKYKLNKSRGPHIEFKIKYKKKPKTTQPKEESEAPPPIRDIHKN